MGLWKRFWNWIRGNAHAAMDAVEDPEKMLNQAVRDMQEQHAKAKQQVAVAIAGEKRLLRQLEEAKSAATSWEERAQKALVAGDEALAKQALERKLAADQTVNELSDQHQKAKSGVDAVKKAIVDLDRKIQEADRKKGLLIARQKRAEAQRTINDTLNQLSTNSTGTTFGDMEDRITQLEAEADAASELAALGPGSAEAEIENQFRALEAGSVDNALEAMKQKLALPAAAEGAKTDEAS